jgi:hypothetical protein
MLTALFMGFSPELQAVLNELLFFLVHKEGLNN